MQTIRAAEQHLLVVTMERSVYKEALEKAKSSVVTRFTSGSTFSPPKCNSQQPPNSNDIFAHYSFDMAQQVFYPNDPLQPGPMYFLTPRKCGVFGVCCESIPLHINYLIDEAVDVGKGANAIVSMLDHFFMNHGLGEKHVHLHADNCGGQNKNSTMVHYLLYRVMTGLHDEIHLSFMITGHTKFSPDWCFGLWKKKYRQTKVSSLTELAEVVNTSASVNFAELVGSELGQVLVPAYDWQSFFSKKFIKLKGIKKLHHLRFTSNSPGCVFVKEKSDSAEVKISLLKSAHPDFHSRPSRLLPTGLSLQRQWYLHDKIREFCPDETKDQVCPKPTLELRQNSRSPSPIEDCLPAIPEHDSETPPPAKKKRLCRQCHQPGHNSRTCTNNQ